MSVWDCLGLYGVAALLVALVSMGVASDKYVVDSDRKTAARVAILSPVWPVMLGYWLAFGIHWVWRMAEFGKAKK